MKRHRVYDPWHLRSETGHARCGDRGRLIAEHRVPGTKYVAGAYVAQVVTDDVWATLPRGCRCHKCDRIDPRCATREEVHAIREAIEGIARVFA